MSNPTNASGHSAIVPFPPAEPGEVNRSLHKLLEDFQQQLKTHLKEGKRFDEAELEKVSKQVFEPKTTASAYIKSVKAIVSDLMSVAHNWREHKNELARKIPLIYISIACIGQCSAIFDNDYTKMVNDPVVRKNPTELKTQQENYRVSVEGPFHNLIDLLQNTADLLNCFKDEVDAIWITIPIHRLQLEILFSLLKPLAVIQEKGHGHDYSKFESTLTNITSVKEICVSASMVVYSAKSISSMLVDHRMKGAVALTMVIVGAAKSFLTMKMDDMLLQGLYKSAMCGFEMFKHYKADQQFAAIRCLCPVGALVAYADLKNSSDRAETATENWMLMSSYINNLLKIAFTALRSITQKGWATTESLRLLRASLVGDANVVGVCTILKRLRKHKKKGFRRVDKLQPFDIVQDAMMNGESMMSTLRKRAMEGLGEVIESVEDKAVQQVDSTLQTFFDGTDGIASYLQKAEETSVSKAVAASRAAAEKKNNTVNTAVNTVTKFDELVYSAMAYDAEEERKKAGKTITGTFMGLFSSQQVTKGSLVIESKVAEDAKEKLKKLEDRLTKVIEGLQAIHIWLTTFLKASNKAINHMRSLDETLAIALKYAKWLNCSSSESVAHMNDILAVVNNNDLKEKLFQQVIDDIQAAGNQNANNAADTINVLLAQKAVTTGFSPPVTVEWHEALIQQQQMNAVGQSKALQNDGEEVQREGENVGAVISKVEDVVSTLSDKMGMPIMLLLQTRDFLKDAVDSMCAVRDVVDDVTEMLGGDGSHLKSIHDKLKVTQQQLKSKSPGYRTEEEKAELLFGNAISSLIDKKQRSVIQILEDFNGLLEPKHWGGMFNGSKTNLTSMLRIGDLTAEGKAEGIGALFKAFEAKLKLLIPDWKKIKKIQTTTGGTGQKVIDDNEQGKISQVIKSCSNILKFGMDALGKGERLFSDLSEQNPQELAPYLLPKIQEQIDKVAKAVEDANNQCDALKEQAEAAADRKKQELQKKIDTAKQDALTAEKEALAKANQLKDDMQKGIKEAVKNAKEALQSKVGSATQAMTRTFTAILASDPDGWGITLGSLLEKFGDCGHSMAILRDGMQTLFGPGPSPDLVEESAMSVCLELQPLLLSMLEHNGRPQDDSIPTSTVQSTPRSKGDLTSQDDLLDALQLISHATAYEIFKARTVSPHPRVQQLFAVDEYRSLVQYTVQVNWQRNEKSLLVGHTENLAQEKTMGEKLENYVQNLAPAPPAATEGTEGTEIPATGAVPSNKAMFTDMNEVAENKALIHAIKHCQFVALQGEERLEASKNATKDLAGGPGVAGKTGSGVAGLVPSVLLKLGELSQQLETVHEKVHESLDTIHKRCEDSTDWLMDDRKERHSLFTGSNPSGPETVFRITYDPLVIANLELERLRKENARLNDENELLKLQNKAYLEDNGKMWLEIQGWIQKYDALMVSSEKEVAEKNKIIKQRDNEINLLKEQLKKKQDEKDELDGKIKQYIIAIQAIHRKTSITMANMRNDLKKMKGDLKSALEEMAAFKRRAEEALALAVAAYAAATEKLRKKLEEEIKKLKEEIEDLKNQVGIHQKRHTDHLKECTGRDKKMGDLLAAIQCATCKEDNFGGKCKKCCDVVDQQLLKAQICQTCNSVDGVITLCKDCQERQAPKQTVTVNEEPSTADEKKCKKGKALADELAAHLLECTECKSATVSNKDPVKSEGKKLELCGMCSKQKVPICPNKTCDMCPLPPNVCEDRKSMETQLAIVKDQLDQKLMLAITLHPAATNEHSDTRDDMERTRVEMDHKVRESEIRKVREDIVHLENALTAHLTVCESCKKGSFIVTKVGVEGVEGKVDCEKCMKHMKGCATCKENIGDKENIGKELCARCQSGGVVMIDGVAVCSNCARLTDLSNQVDQLRKSQQCDECKKEKMCHTAGCGKCKLCNTCQSGGGRDDNGACENCDTIKELQKRIDDLESSKNCPECKKKDMVIGDLRGEIDLLSGKIKDLEDRKDVVKECDQCRGKDVFIRKYVKEVEGLKEEIKRLKKELAEKDKIINDLEERDDAKEIERLNKRIIELLLELEKMTPSEIVKNDSNKILEDFKDLMYGLPCKLYIQLVKSIKPSYTDTVDAIIQLLIGQVNQYPLFPKQPIFDNRPDWLKYKKILLGHMQPNSKSPEPGPGFYDVSKKLEGGMAFGTAPRFEGQSAYSEEEEGAQRRHRESVSNRDYAANRWTSSSRPQSANPSPSRERKGETNTSIQRPSTAGTQRSNDIYPKEHIPGGRFGTAKRFEEDAHPFPHHESLDHKEHTVGGQGSPKITTNIVIAPSSQLQSTSTIVGQEEAVTNLAEETTEEEGLSKDLVQPQAIAGGGGESR